MNTTLLFFTVVLPLALLGGYGIYRHGRDIDNQIHEKLDDEKAKRGMDPTPQVKTDDPVAEPEEPFVDKATRQYLEQRKARKDVPPPPPKRSNVSKRDNSIVHPPQPDNTALYMAMYLASSSDTPHTPDTTCSSSRSESDSNSYSSYDGGTGGSGGCD